MDILSYTESPFARVPRLHHKDALEGPSSAPFGRRNLVGMMGVMMEGGAPAPIAGDTRLTVRGTASYSIYSAEIADGSSSITVDWGDGNTDTVNGSISNLAHTYANTAEYTIVISDDIKSIRLRSGTGMQWFMRQFSSTAQKLTTLPNEALREMSVCESFVLPTNLEYIGQNCFYNNNSYLKYLDASNTKLMTLDRSAFRYCSSLESIKLPSTLQTVMNEAFNGATKLSLVECAAMTAPTLTSSNVWGTSSGWCGSTATVAKVLKVPIGATGYDSGYWADPLCASDKCGFTVTRT